MRCEDIINCYLSFDKFRKNDCWIDISHSLSFSKIFPTLSSLNLPSKSSSTIQAANDCHNPKLPNIFKVSQLAASQPPVSREPASQTVSSQPPASGHPAISQLSASQPVSRQLAAIQSSVRTTLTIYISV